MNAEVQPKKKSRYFGVSWNEKRKKWIAQYNAGSTKRAAYFADEELAARAYDEMLRAQRPGPPASLVKSVAGRRLNFNFPTDEERAADAALVGRAWRPQTLGGHKRQRDDGLPKSSYNGVTWHRRKRKWQVRIQQKPEHGSSASTRFIGAYANEEDAAHAFDDAARSIYGEFAHGCSAGLGASRKKILLNFPTEAERSVVDDAPATTVASASPSTSNEALMHGNDLLENGARAAGQTQLCPFSPRYIEGGLSSSSPHQHEHQHHHQEHQENEDEQLQRQQLYLLRTALMIGGQELYAQVRQPQELLQDGSAHDADHLPIHHT